jgi:hypothetical protein
MNSFHPEILGAIKNPTFRVSFFLFGGISRSFEPSANMMTGDENLSEEDYSERYCNSKQHIERPRNYIE